PKCGGVVQEDYRKFQCQKCDFSLWVVLSGREWSPEEVGELLTTRFIGPLSGFRSRAGKPFSAGIRLTNDFRIEFDFGQAREDEAANPPDFSNQESVGACPNCSSRVCEHGVSYVCERSVGAGRSCDFRSGKLILQQPVEREQMQKLLATGRTDLLTRFISPKRGGRPFKAYLAKKPDGTIGFEFQPRPERPARQPAAPTEVKVREPEPKSRFLRARQPAKTARPTASAKAARHRAPQPAPKPPRTHPSSLPTS